MATIQHSEHTACVATTRALDREGASRKALPGLMKDLAERIEEMADHIREESHDPPTVWNRDGKVMCVFPYCPTSSLDQKAQALQAPLQRTVEGSETIIAV